MNDIAIRADKVSKKYRLGRYNANSLKEEVMLWWKKKDQGEALSADAYFWALKDVSFEIKRGDVVGIIGKNGAGKSTLLKIISRVVLPTSGIVRGNGRVASLLEVGTGFHPELTGRENIYLNGNILGLNKREIGSRFDEIVAFSEIGAFLDTPVKRYSSGMYVRLAFSIAIHMDPDILILDEVLSVGDVDFQKKCLRKIGEITKTTEQTIIFVSHNVQSVRTLCNQALYLEKGKLIAHGDTESVVSKYLLREHVYVPAQRYEAAGIAPGNDIIRIREVELLAEGRNVDGAISADDELSLVFSFWNISEVSLHVMASIVLVDFIGECVFSVHSECIRMQRGLARGECIIPSGFLRDGSYVVHLFFARNDHETLFEFRQCVSFEIKSQHRVPAFISKWQSPISPAFPIILTQPD